MEESLSAMSTHDLRAKLRNEMETGYSQSQLLAELLIAERYVEEDDTSEDETLRGGIRPHRPHI